MAKQENQRGISRRAFIGGALGAGVIAGADVLTGCTSANSKTVDTGSDAADAVEAQDMIVAERPAEGSGYPRRVGVARSEATPILPVDVPEAWDAEVDVVVVGSGMGGLCCAGLCAQGGLSAVMLEKSTVTGGSGRHAYYNLCYVAGTEEQNANPENGCWPLREFDVDDIEQAKYITSQWVKHYQYSVEEKLLRRVVQNGPKYIEWLGGQDGVRLNCSAFARKNAVCFTNADHDDGGWNAAMGNSTMVDMLTAAIEADGVQIMTSTKCEALVAKDGAVVGVKTSSSGGEQYIKASKGVVLAAGGFGFNFDLLEQYTPTAYMYCTAGGPIPEHTGEAFRMGLGMNADFSGYNSFVCWDSGLDDYWGEGSGTYCPSYWRVIHQISYYPIPAFDKRGNRLPAYYLNMHPNAAMTTDEVLNTAFDANIGQYYAGPDHRKYMVWDSHWDFNGLSNLEGTAFPINRADQTSTPAHIYETFCPEMAAKMPAKWEDDFDECVANGSIKKADTIEELEELWGFALGVLVDAVARWNDDCAAGVDSECAVPYAVEFLQAISEPPFYCACMGAQISKTNTGLRVTDKHEVVDASDQHNVIPGLYATWSTAGGFCGENMFLDFGQVSPMGSVALSGTSGYIAAQALLDKLVEY